MEAISGGEEAHCTDMVHLCHRQETRFVIGWQFFSECQPVHQKLVEDHLGGKSVSTTVMDVLDTQFMISNLSLFFSKISVYVLVIIYFVNYS